MAYLSDLEDGGIRGDELRALRRLQRESETVARVPFVTSTAVYTALASRPVWRRKQTLSVANIAGIRTVCHERPAL
jgi:hypothetical protein